MKQAKERISKHGKSKARRLRYAWAASFCKPEDVVLDAACGSDYGKDILPNWIGVDRFDGANPTIMADLEIWDAKGITFDVFCGFETVEHLENPSAYVKVARKARKYIFISCPVSETLSTNQYHKHDYTKEQVQALFETPKTWKLATYIERDVRYGKQGLFMFERR